MLTLLVFMKKNWGLVFSNSNNNIDHDFIACAMPDQFIFVCFAADIIHNTVTIITDGDINKSTTAVSAFSNIIATASCYITTSRSTKITQ